VTLSGLLDSLFKSSGFALNFELFKHEQIFCHIGHPALSVPVTHDGKSGLSVESHALSRRAL
jgi:hypothetical protein